MVMECKCGLMVPSMKAIGKITKHMEKASFGMQMEMFLREIGEKTKLMAMEFTLMSMVQNMMDNGKTIYNMGKE
jgi:hypothetical protein